MEHKYLFKRTLKFHKFLQTIFCLLKLIIRSTETNNY